jgi:uncharacterized protein YxjI
MHGFDDGFGQALGTAERLVVQQKKNWGEILTGFEARTAYEICTEQGAVLARVGEVSEGILSTIGRWMLKGRRPFELVIETAGATTMRLRRPWFWWLSTLEVQDGNGQGLGRIEQRFAIFQRRFEVIDPGGSVVAEIIGPMFHPWTFHVRSPGGGPELARIEKRWSGLMKEAFTDADTFSLSLPRGDVALARMVVAAALLIDFCYFENEGRESGVIGMLTD